MSKKKKRKKKKNFGHYMKTKKTKIKKSDNLKTIKPPTFVLKESEKVSKQKTLCPKSKVEKAQDFKKSFLIPDTLQKESQPSEDGIYNNIIDRFRVEKESNKNKKDNIVEDGFKL